MLSLLLTRAEFGVAQEVEPSGAPFTQSPTSKEDALARTKCGKPCFPDLTSAISGAPFRDFKFSFGSFVVRVDLLRGDSEKLLIFSSKAASAADQLLEVYCWLLLALVLDTTGE